MQQQLKAQKVELQALVTDTEEKCRQTRATEAEAKTRWDLVAAVFPGDATEFASGSPGDDDERPSKRPTR